MAAPDDLSAMDVARFVALLRRHRVSADGLLVKVRSDMVVPDTSNRERTGLSIEHVHYVATLMANHGFMPRRGRSGHDVPVLVREEPPSSAGSDSLARWRAAVDDANGNFPPCTLPADATCFYTSLGNGHFSQALNLFRHGRPSVFTGVAFDPTGDAALRDALENGVPSLVLDGSALSIQDRKYISLMLNSTHHLGKWNLLPSGELELDGPKEVDDEEPQPSQFEALSKVLDAEELSALVRVKLGIDVDEAKAGYSSRSKL